MGAALFAKPPSFGSASDSRLQKLSSRISRLACGQLTCLRERRVFREWSAFHSCRNAINGSIRVARRLGK
jgi:hypothetical protein